MSLMYIRHKVNYEGDKSSDLRTCDYFWRAKYCDFFFDSKLTLRFIEGELISITQKMMRQRLDLLKACVLIKSLRLNVSKKFRKKTRETLDFSKELPT